MNGIPEKKKSEFVQNVNPHTGTGQKKCAKCKKNKSLNEFQKQQSARSGLNYSCKECTSRYFKFYKLKNKDHVKKIPQKLTQKILKQLLTYNPKTGIFKNRMFRGSRSLKGETVGNKDNRGYLCCSIDRKRYQIHRLAWLYIYGYFPENEIDHINRNRLDNRLKNLREASRQCNSRNCKIPKTNTSGVVGVSWSKQSKKWWAQITVNRKCNHLGYFVFFKNAVKARWEAEKNHNWESCNSSSSAYLYLKERGLIC